MQNSIDNLVEAAKENVAKEASPPDETTKKREELKTKLHQLRNLLVYINAQLPNRRARRQWWNDFIKREEYQVQFLDLLIKRIDTQDILDRAKTDSCETSS